MSIHFTRPGPIAVLAVSPEGAGIGVRVAGALAGDWRALEGGFAVTRTGDRVALAPRKADDATAAQIAGITVRLGRFVEQVEITKPNGDMDRLTFTDQVLNAAPLDAAETAMLK